MNLNEQERRLLRQFLLARRSYRTTEIPLGAQSWEPWMEDLLRKIEDEPSALPNGKHPGVGLYYRSGYGLSAG